MRNYSCAKTGFKGFKFQSLKSRVGMQGLALNLKTLKFETDLTSYPQREHVYLPLQADVTSSSPSFGESSTCRVREATSELFSLQSRYFA